jgi:hypothetical protein
VPVKAPYSHRSITFVRRAADIQKILTKSFKKLAGALNGAPVA